MGFFIDPDECSNVQLAQLFAAYAYLIYVGCNMISEGAELLMLTPYSKLVGSCILPILGAVPDGAIVLFSGLGPDAQASLDVGVGALAGSTAMLLTIPWALAIYGGRVDLDAAGAPVYASRRGTSRLTAAGPTDGGVSFGARGSKTLTAMAGWMALTAAPYVVIEVGALLAERPRGGSFHQPYAPDDETRALSLAESPWALAALVLAAAGFGAYLRTQYAQAFSAGGSDKLDTLTDTAARLAVRKEGVGLVAALEPHLRSARAPAADYGTPLRDAEAPGAGGGSRLLRRVLRPYFDKYDADRSGTLEVAELGRVFEDMNEVKSSAELVALFDAYDKDKSGAISFDEFCAGMVVYVEERAAATALAAADVRRLRRAEGLRRDESAASSASPAADDDDSEEDEVPDEYAADKFKSIDEQQRVVRTAALKLCGAGTAIVLAFSDPITDVLNAVGDRIGVNAFYVGFVVAPFITNGSEVLASYTFALKKTQKSMVVANEQLLGAAIMNNTFALFVFLCLVYFRDLYWKYSAETAAILFCEAVMFAVARKTVHTTKTALAVAALYPATILLVWVLENVAGLS